ncbi:MAG: prohibitin family protein [Candidatus Melainabacteria bacterium]|nr:prohibitin family protein [Candidatus Melainabacteria bacterium]
MPEVNVPDFFTPNPKKQQELNTLFNWFNKYWGYLIVFLLLFYFLGGAIVKVDAGERAVIFNLFGGVEKRVLGEGIHFTIPIIQQATVYDVKQITYNFASEDQIKQGKIAGGEIHSLTSDGQKVDVELSVRVKPKPDELWKLHKFIGPKYAVKIIFPKARTTLREVLASYPVEDVYSVKRQEIQNKIQENLQKDLAKKYFIDIEEVLIRNARFSKEFQDAIDRKQQAYQEYLKMEYVIAAEHAKRDSKILQAEGEARAINLRVNALKANPYYIKYRRAQVFGKRAKLIFSENLN